MQLPKISREILNLGAGGDYYNNNTTFSGEITEFKYGGQDKNGARFLNVFITTEDGKDVRGTVTRLPYDDEGNLVPGFADMTDEVYEKTMGPLMGDLNKFLKCCDGYDSAAEELDLESLVGQNIGGDWHASLRDLSPEGYDNDSLGEAGKYGSVAMWRPITSATKRIASGAAVPDSRTYPWLEEEQVRGRDRLGGGDTPENGVEKPSAAGRSGRSERGRLARR